MDSDDGVNAADAALLRDYPRAVSTSPAAQPAVTPGNVSRRASPMTLPDAAVSDAAAPFPPHTPAQTYVYSSLTNRNRAWLASDTEADAFGGSDALRAAATASTASGGGRDACGRCWRSRAFGFGLRVVLAYNWLFFVLLGIALGCGVGLVVYAHDLAAFRAMVHDDCAARTRTLTAAGEMVTDATRALGGLVAHDPDVDHAKFNHFCEVIGVSSRQPVEMPL